MTDAEEDPTKLKCPLCPLSGPPTSSVVKDGVQPSADPTSADVSEKNGQSTESESPDLYWIECSRCKEWYHSVCLLISDERGRQSVPEEIIAEVESRGSEGVWVDWTSWVDRWYCPGCLEWSVDPTNEKRPHHPLVATLNNKTFPPKKVARRVEKRSPERSTTPTSIFKKPRLGSTDSQELPVVDLTNVDGKTGARPKRQAAMNRPDYHALHHHIATPTGKWLELIANPHAFDATISEGNFPRLPAELVSKAWIESPPSSDSSSSSSPPHPPPELFFGPQREPLIIKPEDGGFEGLGGKIPGKGFTVADVGRLVGMDRMVDVIDVATQQSSQWPLSKWVDYVQSRQTVSDPGPLTKTFNIISLEISGTDLAKKVRPPRLVSEIDWVDNFWNFGPAGKNAAKEASEYARQQAEGSNGAGASGAVKVEGKGKAPATWPKVQLYCLMGAKGSWTDWHVDFAASSVYYTVHTGAKTFFFIRPTPKNLAAYAEWSGSYELQQTTWLGSMCDEVRKVTLRAGDTMIIPSGYIHAVHTPEDSIVFGGNFLHSYNIEAQLRLRQIEIDTKVPQRFRFPMFDRLCWYVADRYCSDLRALRAFRPRSNTPQPARPSQTVLEGLFTLSTFLVEQATILEDPEAEEKRRKLIHDRVPAEVVRDPSGLAQELLWRVQREVPHLGTRNSQGEGDGKKPIERNGKKGKGLVMLPSKPKSRVWNFSPSPWEQQDHPIKETINTVYAPRPSVSTPVSAIPRPTGDEQAEETVHTYSQNRTRSRDLADGSTVLEEQKIVFEEKRTIWLPAVVKVENGGVSDSPIVKEEARPTAPGGMGNAVNWLGDSNLAPVIGEANPGKLEHFAAL